VSERADDGYAVMFGGVREAATMFEPYARILARRPDMGWLHCGRCGSGQFVHMIRRAIEAGMHEAYSEGLALIEGRDEMRIDASRVVEAWRSSGIPAVFAAPVASGAPEGHWAAIEAIEQGRPAPVMSLAIAMRAARWNEMESATP